MDIAETRRYVNSLKGLAGQGVVLGEPHFGQLLTAWQELNAKIGVSVHSLQLLKGARVLLEERLGLSAFPPALPAEDYLSEAHESLAWSHVSETPEPPEAPAGMEEAQNTHTEEPSTTPLRKRPRVDTPVQIELGSGRDTPIDIPATQPYVDRSLVLRTRLPPVDRHLPPFPALPTHTEPAVTVRDSSGEIVMPARLSAVFDCFSFINLDLLPAKYRQTYDCGLIPSGANPSMFYTALAKIGGFRFRALERVGADSSITTTIKVLQHDGPGLEIARQRLIKQLTLTDGQGMLVIGPRLCYSLLTLCCMRVSLLTGSTMRAVFGGVAGRSLGMVRVVTHNGVYPMASDELCNMAKGWIRDLCTFITARRQVAESIDMAKSCNDTYYGAINESRDRNGMIAHEMLVQNEHNSRLFLGISTSALVELLKNLVYLVGRDVDEVTMRYLKRLANGSNY